MPVCQTSKYLTLSLSLWRWEEELDRGRQCEKVSSHLCLPLVLPGAALQMH